MYKIMLIEDDENMANAMQAQLQACIAFRIFRRLRRNFWQ